MLRRLAKKPRARLGNSVLSAEPFANLKATVGALSHQDLASANISLPLHDGDDAYPEMLAAINNAKTSVALASYIFRSDKVGHEFIDALAMAVQRGGLGSSAP